MCAQPTSRPSGRWWRRVGVAAALGLAAVPVALGPLPAPGAPAPVETPSAAPPSGSPAPSGPSGSPSGSAAPATPLPTATGRGAQLYGSNCAGCHGYRGQGTQQGPSLVNVGAASVDFQLSTGRMPLSDPRVQEPPHRAPQFSPSDIRALVDYVTAFGGPAGPPIPSVAPGQLQTGRKLYAEHCAACHSATGQGATLTNGWIAPALDRATPTQVGEAVRVGPGLMPAFPPNVLDDQQVNALAGYVQFLQGRHVNLNRGGLALAWLGPFGEGAIAWIVGIGLLIVVIRKLGTK